MLRNYLATALRNLVRDRLYAMLNIVGLEVGFAAVLLIALFVRDELTFERHISGHDNVYHVVTQTSVNDVAKQVDRAPPSVARHLRAESPAIQDVARIFMSDNDPQPILGRGNTESREDLYWADPNIFAVLPLPAVAGDLTTALSAPDAIVITRSLARKYFGRDDVIGETLNLDRTIPLKITAVLEDLPPETHLRFSAFASGVASFSPQIKFETRLAAQAINYQVAYTYVLARPGANFAELQRAVEAVGTRPQLKPSPPLVQSFTLEPINDINLRPANADAMKPSAGRDVLLTLTAVGVLIVIIAGINFINLMTARALRRAVEIGVRKVSGAERRNLIVQFIGETTLYALVGVVSACVLVVLMLPTFNAFVGRSIGFSLSWREWAAIGAAVPVFGLAAGFYPAFVLSAISPGRVLAAAKQRGAGSDRGRQVLVAVQFAIFIGLTLASGVIWRQTQFGMTEGLRLETDAMLVVDAGGCTPAFRNAVGALPGVGAVGCSMGAPLQWFQGTAAGRPGEADIIVGAAWIDFGLLEAYGLKPLAGRFLDEGIAADTVPEEMAGFTKNILVNETAVRGLGFETPVAAVGQVIRWGAQNSFAQIVGVAPDYRLSASSVRDAAPALSYLVSPSRIQRWAEQNQLHVKLTGQNLPETLEAIDSLWKALGAPRPISRFFVDAKVEEAYATTVRQAQIFGAFSTIALFVACLGLFGLSAFTAEQRTKEIGIRKSMGARRTDILKLLLWRFVQPVVAANLIAWPVAYLLMRRWLEGFAYHIDLTPWMFLGASALALVIAMATVVGHALLIARAKPIAALRYEKGRSHHAPQLSRRRPAQPRAQSPLCGHQYPRPRRRLRRRDPCRPFYPR